MDLINLSGRDVIASKEKAINFGEKEQIMVDLLGCFQALVDGQHDSDAPSVAELVSEHGSAVNMAMTAGKAVISVELEQFSRDSINFPGDVLYSEWKGVSDNGDGDFAQVIHCGFLVVDFSANYPSYCDDEYDVQVNVNFHIFNTREKAADYAFTMAQNAYKHDMTEAINLLKEKFKSSEKYLSKDYSEKIKSAVDLLDELN